MLVSDRDGVLFDTCTANIESYKMASEKIGLQANIDELARSIHEGEGIETFFPSVWGDISKNQLVVLRDAKSKFFSENIRMVRVNVGFIESFLLAESNPYLVTRASTASTYFLLDHFKINFFESRIINIPKGLSKVPVFADLCAFHRLSHSELTIIDDSVDTVRESNVAGFLAFRYPHFCNS
jgi:hypothetical protein